MQWERHRQRQLTKPRSPDSQTPCFYHIQKQEGTSGLYHKRLGISTTYLKTNPWSRCPCDHNGGLGDLRVVRWNGTQRLHCERESMHVFKSWNHRRWHRTYREPQFTQLVDPECHSLHWVGMWRRSVLPNLSCAPQIVWHLAKTQGQCGARVCISAMPMLPGHESYFSNKGLNDLRRHFGVLGFFDLCLFIEFGIWVLWQ